MAVNKTLLSRLKKVWASMEKKEDGDIAIKNFSDYLVAVALLHGLIDPEASSSHKEKLQFVREAATKCKREGKETEEEFKRNYWEAASEFTGKVEKKFFLAAKLSVRNDFIGNQVTGTIGGVRITVGSGFPKAIDTSDFFYNGLGHIDLHSPSSYCAVYAQVKGKSAAVAGKEAEDAFAKLLCIVNFSLSRYEYLTSGRMRPHNRIRLSQYHVMFDERRRRMDDYVWYELNYEEAIPPLTLEEFSKVHFRRAMRKISKINKAPAKETIWAALMLYDAANNTADPSVALIKLWAALEVITGSTDRGSKITASRIAFLYNKSEDVQEFLSDISEIRNKVVHLGKNYEMLEHLIGRLRMHARQALSVFMDSKWGRRPHQEFVEFINQPAEIKSLEKKMNLAKEAIRWRTR